MTALDGVYLALVVVGFVALAVLLVQHRRDVRDQQVLGARLHAYLHRDSPPPEGLPDDRP